MALVAASFHLAIGPGRCRRQHLHGEQEASDLRPLPGSAPADQGFSVPDSFSPEQYLADGKAFYAEQAETLRVRYGPAVARWIAEREGRAVDPDGSVTIEHPLADAEWAVRHVLQYGPDAEVLEPESVREEIRRRLAASGGVA